MKLATLLLIASVTSTSPGNTGQAVQDRLDSDIAGQRPIVVHVIVALCDNANQGIVPVPESLGNGQDPRTNLYWGALYGVKTHLPRASGWETVDSKPPEDQRVLERIVLYTRLKRGDTSVQVYLIADAWDGAKIRSSLQVFLEMSAGRCKELIEATHGSEKLNLPAGGSSHLLAYVGHDGLMDFSLKIPEPPAVDAPARSTVVLACASKSFFLEHLRSAGAHPLLLTTGLMAPEAYTLDSAIRAWVETGTTDTVLKAAASAYDQYQKCGIRAAQRLFWGRP